ncbi:MAG TPA: hypothetical protein VNJ08_17880 [Bacteriovoracaceae bacterium]|nr:hypothetical protein [Bacteriovoracaceae bacterium]
MKRLLVVSLMVLSSVASAAQDWKVVAETKDCAEKAQILAKEGEKYVIVTSGGVKQKLFAKDGVFSFDSKTSVQFSSDASQKREVGTPTYTFSMPSMVEANLPKLDVINGSKKAHCNMVTK